MDDVFFKVAAEDNKELAEYLIRPVLQILGLPESPVISAKTQTRQNSLENHDTVLDLLIIQENGTHN